MIMMREHCMPAGRDTGNKDVQSMFRWPDVHTLGVLAVIFRERNNPTRLMEINMAMRSLSHLFHIPSSLNSSYNSSGFNLLIVGRDGDILHHSYHCLWEDIQMNTPEMLLGIVDREHNRIESVRFDLCVMGREVRDKLLLRERTEN